MVTCHKLYQAMDRISKANKLKKSMNKNLFFKLKIDPSDSSWVDEKVEVRYMLRLEETNTLYVKAILKTRDTSITPNINKIQVRVV